MEIDTDDFTHEVFQESDDGRFKTIRVSDGDTTGRFRVFPARNKVNPELNDEQENGEDWTWHAREYVRDEFVPEENR